MYAVIDRWNRTLYLTYLKGDAEKYRALKLAELAADDPTVDRKVFDFQVQIKIVPLDCEINLDLLLKR